jgi:hypothetical protein
VWPFCQLSTNEPYNAPLVEGEHYLCKVAVMYSTGMSAWSEPVEWVYEPCDHWGPVDAVEVNTTGEGNHIEWVFEHGFNPYGGDTPGPGPQPGAGDWYYYDNGVNVDAIGTGGGNFYWGVMFPAGSYTGNTVTKVSAYDYMAMTGNVTIYTGGTNAPGTAVGQTNVTFTGSEDFVEFEFASPVAIDPSQNVWVVFYNGSGATYPAAVCDNTGDANGRWVSIDGTDWMDLVSAGLDNTFMVRAYIASGRGTAQQVNVYGNGDGGTLAVSGNGPRVKNAESMDFVMTSENTAEFNIGNMANYDGRVYFLHKLVNDIFNSVSLSISHLRYKIIQMLNNLESQSVKNVNLSDFTFKMFAEVFSNYDIIVKANNKKYIYFDNIKKFPEKIFCKMPKLYTFIEVLESKKAVYIRVPQQSLGFIILLATDLFDLRQIDFLSNCYCLFRDAMPVDYEKGTEQLKKTTDNQGTTSSLIGPFNGLASTSVSREHLSKKYRKVNCKRKMFGYK